jgi:hypothetical protein
MGGVAGRGRVNVMIQIKIDGGLSCSHLHARVIKM